MRRGSRGCGRDINNGKSSIQKKRKNSFNEINITQIPIKMNAFDLPNLDVKDYCHRYVMFRRTIAIRHPPPVARQHSIWMCISARLELLRFTSTLNQQPVSVLSTSQLHLHRFTCIYLRQIANKYMLVKNIKFHFSHNKYVKMIKKLRK